MESITVQNNPIFESNHKSSTSNALGRAARCFGRNVFKTLVATPYIAHHCFRIATEGLFGVGGAAVGLVRGGTVQLIRAAGSKLELCQQSEKKLSEYVIKDFHRGANIGFFPGEVVGVAGSMAGFAGLILSGTVGLGIYGGLVGARSLTEGFIAYTEIKQTGNSYRENLSKHLLSAIHQRFDDVHNCLYGDKRF